MMMTGVLLTAMLSVTAKAQAGNTPTERKVDVTGKWVFTNQSSYGTSNPTVTFTQKGDSVSGRYSSTSLGDHDFVGTVKDGKINFGFDAEAGGQQFYMAFHGTLDGNDAMAGTIEAAGSDFGTFSGKRQKPEIPSRLH
jgi:hypothetical protein